MEGGELGSNPRLPVGPCLQTAWPTGSCRLCENFVATGLNKFIHSRTPSGSLPSEPRDQVAVAPTHLLCRMPNPFVDQPLVDAGRRAARDEAVTEHVPAMHDLQSRPGQRSLEMVVRFVRRQRGNRRPLAAVRPLAGPFRLVPPCLLAPMAGGGASLAAARDLDGMAGRMTKATISTPGGNSISRCLRRIKR